MIDPTISRLRRRMKHALGIARDRSWSALPTHTYRYIRYADRSTVAEIVAKTMVEADAKLLIETGIDAVTTPSIGCVRLDSSDDAKIVEMIAKTIVTTAQAGGVACGEGLYVGDFDGKGLRIDGDLEVRPLARAILDKLRAEGVVR